MATSRYASYTLLAVSLFFSSCSQEESVRVDAGNSGKIEFRASLPLVATRATETTSSTLREFSVSGFIVEDSSDHTYFLEKAFSKNETTGRYVSADTTCRWPNNNDTVRFLALSPSCSEMRANGGFSETDFAFLHSGSHRLANFRIAGDMASQTDFITAIATGRLIEDRDSGVSLDFKHQLSRIALKAWGDSNSFDLEIAGVRFGGVGVSGDFIFATDPAAAQGGEWESIGKGTVEYIFRAGDSIVTLNKSEGAPRSAEAAVSIMGSNVGEGDGYANSAMLIPASGPAWDPTGNGDNGDDHSDGTYFSVLMRVSDSTPYGNNGETIYPYADDADGMEVIYLAVDKASGKSVRQRLYRMGEEYFTDAALTAPYDPEANEAEVKAFGWAALPVACQWKPGYIYTYSLDYSYGIGLRPPLDPRPGEPILGDRIILDVKVEEWKEGTKTQVTVPRK
ncbi:MAG: fimbrillin family protein [Bacteroides sp.]|nr:fimbrillin family protein [Bacteroides sp.]